MLHHVRQVPLAVSIWGTPEGVQPQRPPDTMTSASGVRLEMRGDGASDTAEICPASAMQGSLLRILLLPISGWHVRLIIEGSESTSV
jgi:hypothetical protein